MLEKNAWELPLKTPWDVWINIYIYIYIYVCVCCGMPWAFVNVYVDSMEKHGDGFHVAGFHGIQGSQNSWGVNP